MDGVNSPKNGSVAYMTIHLTTFMLKCLVDIKCMYSKMSLKVPAAFPGLPAQYKQITTYMFHFQVYLQN